MRRTTGVRALEAAAFWACAAAALAAAATAETADDARPPMFEDVSDLILANPPALRYGACATDIDGDGLSEFFVCGFGGSNLVLKWAAGEEGLVDVAGAALADEGRMAIGVAAGDVDGDGKEELYVLNTDTFGGRKRHGDRLFRRGFRGWSDVLSHPQNRASANRCAGRSVCAVDRNGTGRYGFFVANYGCPLRLYEAERVVDIEPDDNPEDRAYSVGGEADGLNNVGDDNDEGSGDSEDDRKDALLVLDVATAAGIDAAVTGGRSCAVGPLAGGISADRPPLPDIFAGNEGGPNYLFVNKGDGQFEEAAEVHGLSDPYEHARGVVLLDGGAASDGPALACGNWEGPHRLFVRGAGEQECERGSDEPARWCDNKGSASGAASSPPFEDQGPAAIATPSRVRTLVAADFDNDGREELFFNNIGEPNRLFCQGQASDWKPCNAGAAVEPGGLGTGASVADVDGDGVLELLISHGESGEQPLALYKAAAAADGHDWIRVRPLTHYGAPARGAVVELRYGAGWWDQSAGEAPLQQRRVVDGGSGYLCCMEPVAHFGLGSPAHRAGRGVAVRVTWPDGSSAEVAEAAPLQELVVTHPAGGASEY
eukprot:SM000054S18039  [mRNA]  locus=s54:71270:73846:- [translate_table: standard]